MKPIRILLLLALLSGPCLTARAQKVEPLTLEDSDGTPSFMLFSFISAILITSLVSSPARSHAYVHPYVCMYMFMGLRSGRLADARSVESCSYPLHAPYISA